MNREQQLDWVRIWYQNGKFSDNEAFVELVSIGGFSMKEIDALLNDWCVVMGRLRDDGKGIQ